ncbi:glycoside hydrolase family 2 protein [Lentiprolixibacter aurantiacus]|uniref:Beta-glucuronidase n=1 Tax=Lentiprolixibacter aurantiacus TaxID=2993939 RepID=A0AAE3SNY1_9FLAO|nr:glycoside hydrolase family 2 TIM barrel-domain containing protein [Lentiprolixibacter aurantiacus]MCX2719626.1 beta galactosidase jelly roll domain-containing protein [Lentiprolixibacter aurantiacus]
MNNLKLKKALLVFLLLPAYMGTAQIEEGLFLQNVNARKVEKLDGLWQVIVDPLENGYYNHRYQPRDDGYFKNSKMKSPSDLIEYDFDTDLELMVPGDWNTQSDKLYYYEGTVWYKRDFDYLPEEGQRVYVHFAGVNYEARVYLNGEYLGKHTGGFTSFMFEITDIVREKDNFLVVKVDNTRKREGIPTVNTDWWNYGGITRSVQLVSVPRKHIVDYNVSLSKVSKGTIEGWVKVSSAGEEERVKLTIPELSISQSFALNSQGVAQFRIKADPRLWSPSYPKRYEVQFTFFSDSIEDQIGFRKIETRGDKILLNGKEIFLKGISIHEEAPFKTGRVTSREECITLLNWAKELGCNFIRLAHYPHSEQMVQEAERMGLMVWSEIPVYWTIQYDNKYTYTLAEQQLTEMISRDRNRAGIVLWSIANETPVSFMRNDFLKKLAKKARELDDGRLITAALDTHSGDQGVRVIDDPLGEIVDVIGINNYCGWYSQETKSCAAIRWKNSYGKPVIVSEFGAGALQGYHGNANERWTEEYQDAVYNYNIEMLKNMDFLGGVSPWILMDFRSPRRHLKKIQKDFNRKGLISEQGRKKKAFYTLQSYYNKG